MATAEQTEKDGPGTRSKLGLILSLALGLAGVGAGYFGMTSGFIPIGPKTADHSAPMAIVEGRPDVVFVTVPPLLVTLPPGAQNRHLRFVAELEVPTAHQADVEFLMPRIVDLMNGYLRALDAPDVEGPGALFRIRLQLFRRVVMVVGFGKVNSLLIREFVLN